MSNLKAKIVQEVAINAQLRVLAEACYENARGMTELSIYESDEYWDFAGQAMDLLAEARGEKLPRVPDPEGTAGDGKRNKKQQCVIGRYCPEHEFVHGSEAEELRKRLEKLFNSQFDQARRGVSFKELQKILDEVDARDSLAYLETTKPRRKATKKKPGRRKI